MRQLIREVPLDVVKVEVGGELITLPTEAETLRIKGVLILRRNATRDHLDFVALANHTDDDAVVAAITLRV